MNSISFYSFQFYRVSKKYYSFRQHFYKSYTILIFSILSHSFVKLISTLSDFIFICLAQFYSIPSFPTPSPKICPKFKPEIHHFGGSISRSHLLNCSESTQFHLQDPYLHFLDFPHLLFQFFGQPCSTQPK